MAHRITKHFFITNKILSCLYRAAFQENLSPKHLFIHGNGHFHGQLPPKANFVHENMGGGSIDKKPPDPSSQVWGLFHLNSLVFYLEPQLWLINRILEITISSHTIWISIASQYSTPSLLICRIPYKMRMPLIGESTDRLIPFTIKLK